MFWLIPPTPDNVERYVHWILSAKQGDYFLADDMDQCQMIRLYAGNTFIIPSGDFTWFVSCHLHGTKEHQQFQQFLSFMITERLGGRGPMTVHTYPISIGCGQRAVHSFNAVPSTDLSSCF